MFLAGRAIAFAALQPCTRSGAAEPVSRMTRPVPDFCATFVPGSSTAPFAARVIPVTFSPSTARVPALAASLRRAARRPFFRRQPIARHTRARYRVPGSDGNGRAGVRAHLA